MAQCIIDEYNGFCPITEGNRPLCLNGINTQGENIADNGGARMAYGAYLQRNATNGEELRLPGLEKFTPLQLFFLGYAGLWCGSDAPAFDEQLILTDPHSPGVYRINGVMRNMPEFAQQFNCPKGSNMNPANQCPVWST